MAFGNFGRKLTRRDLPLIAQLADGKGLQDMMGAEGIQEALGAGRPSHLAAIAQNHPQPTGSLADSGRPESSVLLGTGLTGARSWGRGPDEFQRSVVRRHGKLMEAHSYGPGTETKYFERKNPAVLQAAARAAAQKQLGQPVAPPSGLAPQDEELLKLLLGNPSLRR